MAEKQNAELPRISMVGTCALLCESTGPLDIEHQQRIWALTEEVSKWEPVLEVMPCLNNLMVIFDPFVTKVETLEQRLVDAWVNCKAPPIRGKLVEIPVVYGGEFGLDLREAAEYARISIEEFVEIHTTGEYVVYALGSHPGFAYMGGLDSRIFVPRRKEPRLLVKAGSVAIGGSQTGVITWATPSGWNLLGSSSLLFFDPAADPPALLAPGDRIRFRAERIER
jgi:KipI family sensor histidine kinase inhibitor